MITSIKRAAALAAVTGALLAAAGTAAQQAASVEINEASLYTGPRQTGTEIPLELNSTGVCHDLPQAAASGTNLSAYDIDVYYNPGCQPGLPGGTGTTFYRLGSLHTGEFSFPALSYRVQATG